MAVSLEPATKVSQKLKDMLNDAIAREIQVSIQYMWQHIQVIGVKGISCTGPIQANSYHRDEARREDC